MVEVLNKIEVDAKKIVSNKVQFLEQNDIKMQKELSEVYDLLREVRTRVGVLSGEMDGRVGKLDAQYKDKLTAVQSLVDTEVSTLKNGLE